MRGNFDVCIRGDGVVGRSLALLLARQRLRIGLVGTPSRHTPTDATRNSPDVRAYSLNSASRRLLEELRCWPDDQHATSVRQMRVWGDDGGFVRFEQDAAGDKGLTWIVDVPALEQRLADALRFTPEVTLLDAPAPAALTVICEGRHSATRDELGVRFDAQPYHQHAVAARFESSQPHRGQALQWFQQGSQGLEILALLPLGGDAGQQFALVWSLPPERARQAQALDADAFAQAVEQATRNTVGTLTLISERATWPLQQACATRWCGAFSDGGAWALAGDAAHNIHPLAGLGLNLGLADVTELAQVLATRQTADYWRGVGDRTLLRRYERARKANLVPIWLACDGLQRLFAHSDARVQTLRNLGMRGFNRLDTLKHWTIQQAQQSN